MWYQWNNSLTNFLVCDVFIQRVNEQCFFTYRTVQRTIRNYGPAFTYSCALQELSILRISLKKCNLWISSIQKNNNFFLIRNHCEFLYFRSTFSWVLTTFLSVVYVFVKFWDSTPKFPPATRGYKKPSVNANVDQSV